jgi:hypothetical protein
VPRAVWNRLARRVYLSHGNAEVGGHRLERGQHGIRAETDQEKLHGLGPCLNIARHETASQPLEEAGKVLAAPAATNRGLSSVYRVAMGIDKQ